MPMSEKDKARLKNGLRYLQKLGEKKALSKAGKQHPVMAGYKGDASVISRKPLGQTPKI